MMPTGEEAADLAQVVAARHEGWLQPASPPSLTRPDIRHQRIAEAAAPFGVLHRSTFRDVRIDRLGWAAIAIFPSGAQ